MQLHQVKPQTSSGGISLFKSNSGVPLHPCSLCIRVFGIHGCAWSLTPESNWTEALATTRLKHIFIHTLFFLRGSTLQHLSKLYQNPCPWIQAWHSARNCTNHPSKSIHSPCLHVRPGRTWMSSFSIWSRFGTSKPAGCMLREAPNTKLYTSLKQPHLTRARIFPAPLDLPSAWPHPRWSNRRTQEKNQLTINWNSNSSVLKKPRPGGLGAETVRGMSGKF